jgi:hypothetical protein
MQKGGQRLDADSGASRVIKVFLAQRPTKTLLTFGTRLYDDLCCLLKLKKFSRKQGPPRRTPNFYIGEGADMLRKADNVVCGGGRWCEEDVERAANERERGAYAVPCD